MAAHSYKKSAVYQKNKQLTLDTIRFFQKRRLSGITKYLVMQLVRALTSVGANLAEGYGRHYKQEYRRFLSIARGSAFEADHWFEIIIELNIFPKDPLLEFLERNQETIRILTRMMKNLESQR